MERMKLEDRGLMTLKDADEKLENREREIS